MALSGRSRRRDDGSVVRGGDGPSALRRCRRRGRPRTDAQVGQLLWAAQGITAPDGRRTAPSVGGTYPLELLAVTADGIRRYLPELHALRLVGSSDVRRPLADAAAGQAFVAHAPLVVLVAAVPSRTEARYGGRAEQYVLLEAFDEAAVARLIGLDRGERALYLVPVGHTRG